MKKSFKILSNRIEDMDNEDSDLTNLGDDAKEKSHLNFEETDWPALPNKSFIFNKILKKESRRFCSNIITPKILIYISRKSYYYTTFP